MRHTLEEFGFTAHIRSRGKEAQASKREAGFKARRWVVERTHSWLNRFRRILIRWDKSPDNYIAFLHFACALIALRAAGLLGRFIVQLNGKPAFSSQGEKTILPSPAGSVGQATREIGHIVSSGASFAEAASQRGILPSIALEQLDQLAKTGTPLKFSDLMPAPDRRRKIEDAITATGGILLAPVRQLLGEGNSYEELKIVRLGLYRIPLPNHQVNEKGFEVISGSPG